LRHYGANEFPVSATVIRNAQQTRGEIVDAVETTTMLFNVMAGLGLFLLGAGMMWFVSVYKDKN
jgi:hypothetical protein